MTETALNKHINTFKTFCKNNRLRLREDGDGLPVARAIGKFSRDQFFCNFKDGTIGVYVTRESQRQFTYLNKKLAKLGCVATQLGDFEASYDLEWKKEKHLVTGGRSSRKTDPRKRPPNSPPNLCLQCRIIMIECGCT